jgi:hypothetical protein
VLALDTYARVLEVISLVSQGRTLTSACREAKISVITVQRACKDNVELNDAMVEAEQVGHDTLSEILLEIDRDPHYGTNDPRMAKVVSDNIKWLLAKKNPKKFGEKIVVENKLTADRAILDALDAAKNRAITRVVDDVAYTVVNPVPALAND